MSKKKQKHQEKHAAEHTEKNLSEKENWDEHYSKMEKEYEEQMKKLARIRARMVIENGKIIPGDNDSRSFFIENFYGSRNGKDLEIHPIEALYLNNVRNISAKENDSDLNFMELMAKFASEPRLFARYNIFRDWKDRGLNLDFPGRMELSDFGRSPDVKYPSKKFQPPKSKTELLYFSEDMISIADYTAELKEFFEDYWFGQVGVYKQHHRDKVIKMDFIETLYLLKNGFTVKDAKSEARLSFDELMKIASKHRPDAESLYDVYEDWRNHSFVLKTGFKFGTHFRLYFPGASPTRSTGDWLHSKHVIHVFPKETRMIMSEWARAVRVAHSVRKTFIMAIPGSSETESERDIIDFIGYHRKKIGIENPKEDKPKFAVAAFTEDEEFGGMEMAAALNKADKLGLRLIIAITDRETAVTYYVAKRISLPGSRNRYYEIEWDQP